MRISIRVLEINRFEEGVNVIRKSFQTVADEFNFTYENNPMHGAFMKVERLVAENAQGVKFYGAFIEEKLVGVVALRKCIEKEYEMEKLAVLPEYRHMGIGRALIRFIKAEVAIAGGGIIRIGIMEEYAILKNWYKSCGFQSVGTRRFKHLPFLVGYMMNMVEGKR